MISDEKVQGTPLKNHIQELQHIKLILKLQSMSEAWPILWIYNRCLICKESCYFTSTSTCTKMKLIQRLWKNSGWKEEHAGPCWCMRTTSPGSDDKLWIILHHSLADVSWRILVCSEAVYAFITSQNRSWYDIRQCKWSKQSKVWLVVTVQCVLILMSGGNWLAEIRLTLLLLSKAKWSLSWLFFLGNWFSDYSR